MFQPEHADQVTDSVARLRGAPIALTNRFYQILFSDAPETREMFAEDISVQSEKLHDVLLTTLQSIHSLDELAPTLRDLGRLHAGLGVKEAHYPIVGKALIAALQENVEDWGDADRKAWTALYQFLARTMIAGAHDARDKGESAA